MNNVFLISFGLAALLLISCEKMVQVKPPVTHATSQQVFENNQLAQSAASGVYIKLRNGFIDIYNGGTTILAGLSADELGSTFPQSDFDIFENNELNQFDESSLYNRLWRPAYSSIYHANAVIEGLDKSPAIDIELKSRLKGEMLTVRAFCYFYLANFFGNVPLVLSTNFDYNKTLPSSNYNEIMDSIVHDLEEAVISFKEYNTLGSPTRANFFAANALLARVYLYKKDWARAEHYSTEVIEPERFSLTSLDNTFLISSSETIWSLQSIIETGYNTAEGTVLLPYNEYSIPMFYLKANLLSAFEPGDGRLKHWIGLNTAIGNTIFYPMKYRKGYSTDITENYVILRIAEQYLIRAEARAQLNLLSESMDDLNVLRERALLTRVEGLGQQDLIDAIFRERRIELFSEWGHRWFDLKRLDKADAILGVEKAPNWQPTDILYPIPYNEIRVNPKLIQNPGYN